MVPDPTVQNEDLEKFTDGDERRIGWLIRSALLIIAVGLIAVFAVAILLDPYRDGKVWLEGTHQQLGLQQCTFKTYTGYPCPSCGMTSSFALLMHGDPWNSLQANAVGTLLALFCLWFVPWSVACIIRGKMFWLANAESFFLRVLVIFLVLMLLRWAFVLAVTFRFQ